MKRKLTKDEERAYRNLAVALQQLREAEAKARQKNSRRREREAVAHA